MDDACWCGASGCEGELSDAHRDRVCGLLGVAQGPSAMRTFLARLWTNLESAPASVVSAPVAKSNYSIRVALRCEAPLEAGGVCGHVFNCWSKQAARIACSECRKRAALTAKHGRPCVKVGERWHVVLDCGECGTRTERRTDRPLRCRGCGSTPATEADAE